MDDPATTRTQYGRANINDALNTLDRQLPRLRGGRLPWEPYQSILDDMVGALDNATAVILDAALFTRDRDLIHQIHGHRPRTQPHERFTR